MTTAGTGQPLLDRISRLRGKVRRLTLAHGVALVLAAFLAIAVVLSLLDYWLHFAGALRLVLALVVLGGLVGGVWRFIARPLQSPLGNTFLAARVEDANPLAHDELMSAVGFLESQAAGNNALAKLSVAQAEALAAGLDFSRVADGRLVWRAMALAGLALLVVLGMVAANPLAARLSLERWLTPLVHNPWPRSTHVAFLWPQKIPPQLWPRGEPLTVQAVVDKGFSPTMHVWLVSRAGDRQFSPQLMTLQHSLTGGRGVFARVIQPEGRAFAIKVLAGDDLKEKYISIRVVPRPTITQ